MAKKTKLFKFDSSAVQGEGSFVVMRKVPWGPMRQAMGEEESLSEEALGMKMLQGMLPDLITAWNWTRDLVVVDEDGDLVLDDDGEMQTTTERLPLPSRKPGLIDALDFDEVMFLVEKASSLIATEKPEKN